MKGFQRTFAVILWLIKEEWKRNILLAPVVIFSYSYNALAQAALQLLHKFDLAWQLMIWPSSQVYFVLTRAVGSDEEYDFVPSGN